MPTPGLQSHTAATRHDALKLAELEADHIHRAELEEVATLKRVADAKVAAAKADAREKVERTRRLRSEALAEEARAELGPLIAERMAQPSRDLDRRLQAALVEIDRKVGEQVGGGIGASPALSRQFVITIFTDELVARNPDAVSIFQANDFGMGPVWGTISVGRALELGPVAFGQWVDNMEAHLERALARGTYPATQRHRELYEAKRATVHDRDHQADQAALSARYKAEDDARSAQQQEAIVKKQGQGLLARIL